jgi:RNA recognition motif-containing protein
MLNLIFKYLFVGNCGLDNNISSEFVHEVFRKHGQIIDIVMQKKKPYSFIIYENPESSIKAIESLQGQVITTNQTPICFYLFTVDKGSSFMSVERNRILRN